MIRFVLVCLILAFVVTESAAFDPAPGARKCARNSLAKEYKYSAAVFIGEVVKVSKEGNVKQFEFDVERYWKGVSSKKIVLSVYENVRFQAQYKEGRRYLVFAKKSENNDILIDRRCSRSTEINEYSTTLETDLEKLGEAKTCIDLKEKEVDE